LQYTLAGGLPVRPNTNWDASLPNPASVPVVSNAGITGFGDLPDPPAGSVVHTGTIVGDPIGAALPLGEGVAVGESHSVDLGVQRTVTREDWTGDGGTGK
jgi:hypothetical protein